MDSATINNNTIEENWPKVIRPKIEDTIMLDCKIDVSNTEMPIEFDQFLNEFTRMYYEDCHHICNRLLLYFKNMLE
jgi:hypothetical protein